MWRFSRKMVSRNFLGVVIVDYLRYKMALIALVECGLLISRKKILNYIKMINFFYSDERWIGDLLKFPNRMLRFSRKMISRNFLGVVIVDYLRYKMALIAIVECGMLPCFKAIHTSHEFQISIWVALHTLNLLWVSSFSLKTLYNKQN